MTLASNTSPAIHVLVRVCNRISIKDVGERRTVGWAVIPICLEGFNVRTDLEKAKPTLARIHMEVHIMRKFEPGILLGLDALRDYNIDLDLVNMMARVRHWGFEYPLAYARKPARASVLVKTAKAITIPGRIVMCVTVRSAMLPGYDYIMEPFLCWEQGSSPHVQLPKVILNSSSGKIMFRNTREHPIRLDKGMSLGRADIVQPGARELDLGAPVDWSDISRPAAQRSGSIRLAPPTHYVDSSVKPTLNVLAGMAAITTGKTKPRSISEEVTRLIAKGARPRQKFEMFPLKPDDKDIPSSPNGKTTNPEKSLSEMLLINPALSVGMKEQLMRLLNTYEDAFSMHGEIGKIKGFQATIPTEGALPLPQPLYPMSNLKKSIVEEAIEDYGRWDVIEPSSSPTCSAIILVWQNSKCRFCVDFRALNKVTVSDAYPML